MDVPLFYFEMPVILKKRTMLQVPMQHSPKLIAPVFVARFTMVRFMGVSFLILYVVFDGRNHSYAFDVGSVGVAVVYAELPLAGFPYFTELAV